MLYKLLVNGYLPTYFRVGQHRSRSLMRTRIPVKV